MRTLTIVKFWVACPESSKGVALAFLALGLATLAGCQQDEIQHYQAPRLEIPPQQKQAGAVGPQRMITAIFPQQDRTWFFKLTGDPDEVQKHIEEFEHFLKSVRFVKGDPPVTWTVPQGWQREAGAGLRFATFRCGAKDNPLEVTVTPLGREAGSLASNINRWRDQLGLPPADEKELAKSVQETEVDGIKVRIVDLTGTGTGKGRMPPFANARPANRRRQAQENQANGRLPFTYRAPEGWKELPGDGISVVSFEVGEGNQAAKVTVTPAGGDLAANVNRWRDQVGLKPASDEEIKKDNRPIDVGGSPGQYVDLTGPEGRILAVLVPRGGETWFFKMKGPPDAVVRQKAAFETFIGSVRFTGG
jgi:hypothetical protein